MSAWELRTQLRFVWYELHSTERRAWDKLCAARNVTEAAVNVEIYYERPGVSVRDLRIRYAKETLSRYSARNTIDRC